MKKLLLPAGFLLVLVFSCETGNEIVLLPSQSNAKPDSSVTSKPAPEPSKPDSAVVTPDSAVVKPEPVVVKPDPVPAKPVEVTPADIFDYVYRLSFRNNTAGAYAAAEWKSDWLFPEWANNKYGYGTIASESGNKHLALNFPAGSFQAGNGYQWHCKFSKGYDELYFSYQVKFSSGFSGGNLAGKLPGLSGGSSNSGGNLPTGKDGWSARYMFHGTNIKFYMYYPDLYKYYGDARPVSGKTYYGNGPDLKPGFTLKTGVWYTITQRIVMNTPGKADGLAEGFINGKLCASQKGIRFRDISTLQADRIFFSVFFGGSGEPPVKTETISFDNFVVFTYKPSVAIARNNVANPAGTVIQLPQL